MESDLSIDEQLAKTAHALRPARLVSGRIVHYSAVTFPSDPRSGCERTLRIAQVRGDLGQADGDISDLWIDVLDQHGDILQEWPVGPKGFELLRSKLRFVRESGK
jgi:hypothetical protein